MSKVHVIYFSVSTNQVQVKLTIKIIIIKHFELSVQQVIFSSLFKAKYVPKMFLQNMQGQNSY